MAIELEVFRDLNIRVEEHRFSELRAELISLALSPWSVDLDRSAEAAGKFGASSDILLFRREATQSHPEVGLTLYATDGGYEVPNVVPIESGSLTYAQYNEILADFAENVAGPACRRLGLDMMLSKPKQTLDDWLSPDAAAKLRKFSAIANRASRASHPTDERYWFDFVISTHRSGADFGPDRLARWLKEVDGWDDDATHELAGQFETALSLLKRYDVS